jgi:acyl-CoA thioesterase-1
MMLKAAGTSGAGSFQYQKETKIKRYITQIGTAVCLLIVLCVFLGCDTISGTDNRDDVYDHRPIVCFGDSLTDGDGAPDGQSYPDYLQQQIRVDVINAGVSGDTTAGGLARLNRDVLSKDPQIVIIEFGANDLSKGVTIGQLKSNLEQMITQINDDNRNRKIFIADWLPDSDSIALLGGLSNFTREYRSMLDSLEKISNVEIVDDIFKGIFGDPALMSDPLHPNSKGYKIMADNYLKAIRPYLQANKLLK